MNNKPRIIFFLFIFALALCLRLGGIGYGLPDLSHPDEARVILDTLSMGHRMSLLPERPDYALLYRYFLLFLFGVYFVIGKIAGAFKGTVDFALNFMINPSHIYLIARSVSVLTGTAIGAAAYFLGKRIFKRAEVGLAALVFCLFEFQLLQHSQWALYSIAFSLFTLPALYAMFRLAHGGSLRDFALAGGATGLAISVQNQGIYLLPSLALAAFFAWRNNAGRVRAGVHVKNLGLLAASLTAAALAGNFYWFFVFNKSLAKTLELMGVTQVGFSSQAPFRYGLPSMSLWFFRELIRQDGMLGILMTGGVVYSAWRRTRQDVIFLVFLFFYLLVVSSWGFRFLHDTLALLPVLCIFAARFLVEATQRFIKRPLAYALVSLAIVSPLAAAAFRIDLQKNMPDTRQLARNWIEENIPSGSTLALDWQIFSVPLKSDMPFLFRNPIAQRYYERMMPGELKARYARYLSSQKTYRLLDIMYATDEPLWPAEMPAHALQKARSQNVYRDLYSRFNFKPLPVLKQEGAQYVVITSYAWGFFLFDDDPAKENLFNAFVRDNPKASFRHARDFVDDGRHGIIYYLAKQGRDFYEPFLRGQAPGIRLIKEFVPGKNLGPTIKIFRVSNG